jgi:hypothetical protein
MVSELESVAVAEKLAFEAKFMKFNTLMLVLVVRFMAKSLVVETLVPMELPEK